MLITKKKKKTKGNESGFTGLSLTNFFLTDQTLLEHSVSSQNLADTTIPQGFSLATTPPTSCTAEVLPVDILSVSDAVRSEGTEHSFTEFESGFC